MKTVRTSLSAVSRAKWMLLGLVLAGSVLFLRHDAMALQAPVNLGSADSFAILAGTTVTSTNGGTINGNVGVSPGSAFVGGNPAVTVNGNIHLANTTAAQAQLDLNTAYIDASGRTLGVIPYAQELGAKTLAPGLYKSASGAFDITSVDLTLDAQGDPNAVWIFQMASTLTVNTGRQVILSGGAQASNIFWQVGSSATLETTTVFKGTILAYAAISIKTGASLNGRALAQNAAVTLDGNIITTPSSSPSAPTVTTTPVTNVINVTAKSGGTVSSANGSTVTARGVCWNTTGTPTTADSKTTNETGTGSFTSAITGLTASTTYYVRAYATNSSGTAYGSQGSFTTTSGPPAGSGKFIIWQNADTGEIQWWSLAGSGRITSDDWDVGRGKVSESTLNGDWRFVGSTTVTTGGSSYGMLFYQNINEGIVRYWMIDNSARLVSAGNVSDTIRVAGAWRAAGVSTGNGVRSIIWQNQSTGKVVYWRIGEDGKLVNATKDDGWGFVAEQVTLDSEWLITGIRETENGERMLLWQNQSSGLVAYWKLNEQAKLINSTRDEGWGYVSGTLVGSQWRLIGVSGSNTLLWQNQSAGKVVWWRINENGKLPNTTRDNGWGFVSETLTGPSWYLVDIANLSGTQTLFWHNQSSGQAAYWRLNESTKLTNTTRNDGWGLVSDVLTASGAWRMNCVTK